MTSFCNVKFPFCNFRNRLRTILQNKKMACYFHFNEYLWKGRCRFEGNLVLGIRKILSHGLFVYQFSVFATVSFSHFHSRSVFKCSIPIAAVTLHTIYYFHYHWNHEKINSKEKARKSDTMCSVTLYSYSFDNLKIDMKNDAIYNFKIIFGFFYSYTSF